MRCYGLRPLLTSIVLACLFASTPGLCAEDAAGGGASRPAQKEAHARFQIQRIYLKEVALIQPNAPAIFLEKESPTLNIKLEKQNQDITSDVFENRVKVTITAKVGGKVAFVLTAVQAGIFEVHDITAPQRLGLLKAGCPSILYPYLRTNVTDMIVRAGFPPIYLAEVDFEKYVQ
jgi:preprotein translocase subunit SecB